MQNNQSANKNTNQMAFPSARKLSVIAPVQNDRGETTVQMEHMLQLLYDSKVEFELMLLDMAAEQPASESIRLLSQAHSQVRNLYCPTLAIQDAISLAIKSSEGDMILVLDEGIHAIGQLKQLLAEQFANRSSNLEPEIPMDVLGSQQGEFTIGAQDPSNEMGIDQTSYDVSGLPEIGGIDGRVLERLEQWAVALQNESKVRAKENLAIESPALEIPQTRPHEKDSRSRGDEIRRVDPDPGGQPKRKLPKFVTRFHEFI